MCCIYQERLRLWLQRRHNSREHLHIWGFLWISLYNLEILDNFMFPIVSGRWKPFCTESRLWRWLDLRVWHEMVKEIRKNISWSVDKKCLLVYFLWNWKYCYWKLHCIPDYQVPIWHPILRNGKNHITNPYESRIKCDTKKVLECEGNSGEFVELVPEQLNYLGPKDLTQYFIRSIYCVHSLDNWHVLQVN